LALGSDPRVVRQQMIHKFFLKSAQWGAIERNRAKWGATECGLGISDGGEGGAPKAGGPLFQCLLESARGQAHSKTQARMAAWLWVWFIENIFWANL
jgi:hypothetical protein